MKPSLWRNTGFSLCFCERAFRWPMYDGFKGVDIAGRHLDGLRPAYK
jgi:hypothetical protein